MGKVFGSQTIRRVGLTPDKKGLTAPDYAKLVDDPEVGKVLSMVMGDATLSIKPLSSSEILPA